jgi:UDP-N-acetylglucosamine 4-epimerase
LTTQLAAQGVNYGKSPVYRDFRAGDVRHSLADIGRAHARLGYAPTHTLQQGLGEAMPWYVNFIASQPVAA